MVKTILIFFISVLATTGANAQVFTTYHEQTTAIAGCSGLRFASTLTPTPADTVILSFTATSAVAIVKGWIYYTTDGSNPSGAMGTGTANTQVAACTLVCNTGNISTLRGAIPPQQGGALVKYVVSVLTTVGNTEVFGNSSACSGCNPITTSTNARSFAYVVQGVLPINFVNITALEGKNSIRVFWGVAQETNMAYYEIYQSRNSLHFDKIGTRTAVGSSNGRVDYYFDDKAPNIGNNYYRIVGIDQQGKTAATKIIRVLFGKNDNSVVIFANPAADILNLRVADVVRGLYAIRIFDNLGRRLFDTQVQHNGADGVYPIYLPQPMAKGNYRLVFTNRYQFYTASFMIR
jgi:hypothetical protein